MAYKVSPSRPWWRHYMETFSALRDLITFYMNIIYTDYPGGGWVGGGILYNLHQLNMYRVLLHGNNS